MILLSNKYYNQSSPSLVIYKITIIGRSPTTNDKETAINSKIYIYISYKNALYNPTQLATKKAVFNINNGLSLFFIAVTPQQIEPIKKATYPSIKICSATKKLPAMLVTVPSQDIIFIFLNCDTY